MAQILGHEAAPWDTMAEGDRRKLGAFKGPILELLRRDPAQRPTMPQFYAACNAIFASSTTYVAGKGSPLVPPVLPAPVAEAPDAAAGSPTR